MNRDDPLDKVFHAYLKEIQREYSKFSKAHRIRIEKWVDKLANCCSKNSLWKKNRNAYAKLLLNMVIEEKLEEPFNIPPQDGSLPTFPQYLAKSRNLLGSHESSFWRNMFKKLERYNELDDKTEEKMDDCTDYLFNFAEKNEAISTDINNLKLLAKEQQQRIELLESILREERVNHELEMQKIRYAQGIEIANIKLGTDRSTVPGDLFHPQSTVMSMESFLSRTPCPMPNNSDILLSAITGCDSSDIQHVEPSASKHEFSIPTPRRPPPKPRITVESVSISMQPSIEPNNQYKVNDNASTRESHNDDFLKYIDSFRQNLKKFQ